jgi:hypothetical protein
MRRGKSKMEYEETPLGKDMRQVKENITVLKNRPIFRETERTGLYIIALLGMIGALKSCSQTEDLPSRTQELLNRTKPLEVRTENVMGNPEPEKFYMVNGNRAFVEIDGQPVDTYISSHSR